MHSHRCWFKYYLNIYRWFLIKKLPEMTLERRKSGFPALTHISLTQTVGWTSAMHVNQSQPPTRSTSDSSRRLKKHIFFCFFVFFWYAWMKGRRERSRKCSPRNPTPFFCPDFLKVKQPISAHLPHTTDTQIPAGTNAGHGSRWLKQRGTQSDFLRPGCFCRLIITLVFICRLSYALYRSCPPIEFLRRW